MFDSLYESILMLTVCQLIVLGVLLLIYFLLARYLFFRKDATNKKEKLISIGFSALIFPGAVQNVFISPFAKIVANLQSLFYTFDYLNKAKINNEIREKIIKEPPQFDISFFEIVSGIQFADFLGFVALSIFIYWIIIKISQKSLSIPSITLPKLNLTLIANIGIGLLLVFALFLVVSAFICIPYFNEMRKPTVFTRVKLDSTLSRMSNTDSFSIGSITRNPFGNIAFKDSVFSDSMIKNSFDRLSPSQKLLFTSSIDRIQLIWNSQVGQRMKSISDLEDFAKKYSQNESKVKMKLSQNFENRSQSITTNKNSLFQSTVENFESYVSISQSSFNNYKREIVSADEVNNAEISGLFTRIASSLQNFEDAKNRRIIDSSNYFIQGAIDNYLSIEPPYLKDYPFVSQDRWVDVYTPNSESDGSDWGFFGTISKYLIRTGSSELVLLIGMFGFGLLGASILSFEKLSSFSDFATTPIIKNFVNVLARGFGAALVVYMAIKAGLTIFSAGTSADPNGYMLLLSCFAGAVFSDLVWEKIKGWVGKG